MNQVINVTGQTMPAVGLGLWKLETNEVAEAVYNAIKNGYRHLDSAADYGNEQQVGEGIARALKDGLCSREDLWITSKLWNTFHRKEYVQRACEKSLSDLGLRMDCVVGKTSGLRLNCGTLFIEKNTFSEPVRNLCQIWG